MSIKLIIDTDPGIDDAMAIFYALLDPSIELLGLSTIFGNVTTPQATRNAIHLLEYFGADLPVAQGALAPLVQPPNAPSYHVHGAEGFGKFCAPSIKAQPIAQSAAQFICEQINKAPKEVTVCAIGPLSNIALALQLDKSIAQKLKSLVLMGGSFRARGNVTKWAEANMWNDPHAADLVFGADWPIKMIGLDVTQHVVCTRQDFQAIADTAPMLGGFLNQIAQFYIDFYEKRHGVAGCHLHDPTAVIAAAHPELFSVEKYALGVKMQGDKIGKTIHANDARKPIEVAMAIDASRVKAQFFDTIKSGF